MLWVFFLQTSFDFVTSFLGGCFVPFANFYPKLKNEKEMSQTISSKVKGS